MKRDTVVNALPHTGEAAKCIQAILKEAGIQ